MQRVDIKIYTDGSSLIKGEFYEASSSTVTLVYDKLYNVTGEYHPGGTNNWGEVFAMKRAFEMVKKIEDKLDEENIKHNINVSIMSDSDYTVKSCNNYMDNWYKKAGKSYDQTWYNSKGEPIASEELFKTIHKLKHSIDAKIKIYHMRGHIGVKVDYATAKKKFMTKHNITISDEDFRIHIKYNDMVDKSADLVRRKLKCDFKLKSSELKGIDNINDLLRLIEYKKE